MFELFSSVAIGLGIGWSLAAPPGPMSALIARESSRHGFLAGIRAGIIAPMADTVMLFVVLLGVSRLQLGRYVPWAALAGAGLMVFLALQTVRISNAPGGVQPKAQLSQIVFLGVTNPYMYAWWATAGTALMADKGLDAMVGFLIGIFSWVFILAFLMAHGANRWSWFVPAITVLSADLLLVFALVLARTAMVGF